MQLEIESTTKTNFVAPRLGDSAIEDLVEVYSLQEFAASRGIVLVDSEATLKIWVDPHEDLIEWQVELRTPSGETATKKFVPIHRQFGREHPLAGGTGKGRVMFHQTLCLEPEFCGRGLGSEICDRELALYRRWSIKEVQLIQSCEANTHLTWLKRGFRMTQETFDVVSANFESVFRKQYPELSEVTLATDWRQWPQQFLKDFGTINRELPLFLELS